MMTATLERIYRPKQTEGFFTLFSEDGKVLFTCRTLELPNLNNQSKISCIPEGIYFVKKHVSPSQGQCYSIPNVPFRDHILIHKGNYVGSVNPETGHPDILGCVLVGNGLKDITGDGIPEITGSSVTLKKLLSLADNFNLTIKKYENKTSN